MSSSSEENVQSGPSDYVSDRTFADFPISPEVLKGLTELGYSAATPVQAMMIDPALAGRDLLVRAKTGTGKTAAFSVPLVEQIAAGDRKPRGLVLTPTRELAIQVAQECAAIAKYKDLRIAVIYGGVGFGPQEQALHDGVEIVVGTPGRVLDHVKRGNLVLSELRHAVLDEADEMLSMGFLEDVRKILDRAPKDRQNIFVSATINETIKGLIGSYLKEPEEIFLSVDGQNVSNINHVLYETSPDYHKARALLDLIEQERPGSALIFCNTREDVNTVYTFLDRQGLGVEMISGELPQTRREKVMARVKAGAVQFLVATDVAARGIDISDLTHVINYALPEDAAVYLHRCGRTGRIGKMGTALTLAGGGDFSTRLTLERQHKILFEVKQLPTPEESSKLRAERIARTIKDAAGTSAYESWLDVARQLKDRPDADTIIAVALRGFFQWDRVRRAQAAEEAGEAPSEPAPRREERADRGDRGDRDRGRDRDRGGRGRDDRRDTRGGRDGGRDRDRDRDRPRDRDRDRDRDRGERRPEAAPAAPAAEVSAEAPSGEAAASGEGRGRRRRRGRGGRDEGAPGEAAPAEAVEAAGDEGGPDEGGPDEGGAPEGNAGEGGEGARRKRRRRRRGGRKDGGAQPTESAPT